MTDNVTTDLAETLAAVPTANDPAEPFTYTVRGEQIVGTWDIVKATSLYPAELDHVDKSYAITLTLDSEKGTYDFSETNSEKHATLDGGGLSFGTSKTRGKGVGKEFSFEFGGVNKTKDGVSTRPVVYSFETSRIKKPLFAFVEQHGWQPQKKGLLSRLFRH